MNRLTDKEYYGCYGKVPRLCVDLFVSTKDGILLIKRQTQPYKGKMHIPGGRVLFRESITKAIHRIAKKELNSKVRIGEFLGFMEFRHEVQRGIKMHSVSLAFIVKPYKRIDGFYYNQRQKNVLSVHKKFLDKL